MKLLTVKKALKYATAGMLCALYCIPALAADGKHELLTVEAAENVKFSSQTITKAYFYKQQGVRTDRATEELDKSLALLKKDLLVIQDGIKEGNKEEKNITIFLEYTLEELQELVKQPYSKDNGALMIDYSESLLEGAEYVTQLHMHPENTEEAMLVTVEELLFLLERINKFYIAYQAGFKDYNNVVQLKQTVKNFEDTLSKVNAYTKYADEVLTNRNKVNEFWPVAKEFFIDIQKGALPVIVLASVEKLANELEVLEKFHHNNITAVTE